jgi:hypothetical protein
MPELSCPYVAIQPGFWPATQLCLQPGTTKSSSCWEPLSGYAVADRDQPADLVPIAPYTQQFSNRLRATHAAIHMNENSMRSIVSEKIRDQETTDTISNKMAAR